ncbi:MAG: glycosyltransferase family 1 protein [Syntrophobacteraceae bacterium]
MEKKKLKVLMELRPTLEGFAGIPQETRLVFCSLNKMDNLEVTGLINTGGRRLWPGLKRGPFAKLMRPHRRVHKLSRLAISVKVDPIGSWWDQALNFLTKKFTVQHYSFLASMGIGIRVYDFDATDFGDFVWQTMFSKTLPAREYDSIRNARFASVEPSWDLLNRVSIKRMRMVGLAHKTVQLNTHGFDVFLTQTPFPGTVPPKTQLVVRYHDAIPIFLPHTISESRTHQHAHMANLIANQKSGIFACTSSATRSDLLKIFPALESRSVVIPDTVSNEYYEEEGTLEYISNIVRNHICVETEPKFLTSREKENFYNRNLMSKPLRYIMMVSTLEPRKNHSKLIAAWDYLKNHGMSDLKLILVGTPGWDFNRILDSMAPWQQRGEIYHLQHVPSGQLRVLYNAAQAVVCPSVAEGFDLSGIEAMLCGGAVVASDIPVHREVYRNACVYFNPYSALDQAKAIERVIHPDNREQRSQLVAAGLQHAPRYRLENIQPYWDDLFEKIRAGAFKPLVSKLFFPGWNANGKKALDSLLRPVTMSQQDTPEWPYRGAEQVSALLSTKEEEEQHLSLGIQ